MEARRKRDPLTAFKIGFGLAFGLQPFEVLRTRLVLDPVLSKMPVRGMVELSKGIFQKEGIRGFWKGSSL